MIQILFFYVKKNIGQHNNQKKGNNVVILKKNGPLNKVKKF